MSKKKEFNYCVAHYWEGESGSIGAYTRWNDIFYGTMKEAKKFLKYVKQQSPDREWKIFQIVEIPE